MILISKEKDAKKAYKKMNKHYKATFKKLAKNIHPFDYGYTLELLVEHLKYMQEYYKIGYNVCAEEDTAWKSGINYTRLDLLNMILAEYDAWQNCHNKYFKCYYKENIDNTKNFDSFINNIYNNVIVEEYKLDTYEATVEACNKEEQEHRTKFFKLLADHIEELWD